MSSPENTETTEGNKFTDSSLTTGESTIKTVKGCIVVGVIFVLLVSSGCNKKESATNPTAPGTTTGGTASFTLNGAGFTNQSFSITGMVGGYSVSDKMSGVTGSSATTGDSTMLTIVFPGAGTGTFPFSDTVGVVISRGTGATQRGFVNGIGGGQIVVTAYGAVGGSITGSFSGKLYEVTSTRLDSVTVSNGSFNALRVTNQ
jgi:hypothetical protein